MGNLLSMSRLEISPKIEQSNSPLKEANYWIIFVLGGPGTGKGEPRPVDENPEGKEVLSTYWLPQTTQCEKIAEKYDFVHISSGDLLRDEARKSTDRGEMVDKLMAEQKIIPDEIILELIKEKMLNALSATKGFVFEGFPREKHQVKLFEKEIRSPDMVIYLKLEERLIQDRLQGRAVTSGRKNENDETLRYRIKQFLRKNHSIIKHYEKNLTIIDANRDIETIFNEISSVIDDNISASEHSKQVFSETTKEDIY